MDTPALSPAGSLSPVLLRMAFTPSPGRSPAADRQQEVEHVQETSKGASTPRPGTRERQARSSERYWKTVFVIQKVGNSEGDTQHRQVTHCWERVPDVCTYRLCSDIHNEEPIHDNTQQLCAVGPAGRR